MTVSVISNVINIGGNAALIWDSIWEWQELPSQLLHPESSVL